MSTSFRIRSPFHLLVALALWIGAPAHAQEGTPSLDSIQRLIRAERWAQAIEGLEAITAAQPDQGRAWFYLAYCHHNAGDLRRALEVGVRAAEFPALRATALYNLACAHSLLEEIDPAAERLAEARRAGFLDFDLMESDPELANLRAQRELDLPAKHEYARLTGRNRIVIPYRVLLPDDFDAERESSVAVFFAPDGGGQRSTDWCIDELWGGRSTLANWIVVCAVAPENGWINHPSHHALEDLFKHLRSEYRVASNRFHLVGFGAGARVAATYSGMSRRYTASVTVASATCFDGWDDGDFGRMRGLPVHLLVGTEDEPLAHSARSARAGFERKGVSVLLTEFDGDGPVLESLRAGGLLNEVARCAALGAD